LRNPTITRRHKGRAIVPITRTLKAALLEARQGALSNHVIEWAGKPVQKPRRALARAGRNAGIGHVHPHLLRHSAAVHMAEDGVPIEEIAQYLGHSDVNVTRKIYARFSPDYLRKAAASLEYDDLGAFKLRKAR
jgi:integrase